MRIKADDGAEGTGYSYTIGNGGSAVVALLRDTLSDGCDEERKSW